jgi:hypothetical protein
MGLRPCELGIDDLDVTSHGGTPYAATSEDAP